MLTLEKVERMVGMVAHLPPCSQMNYQVLADNFRDSLKEWRNELQTSVELTKALPASVEYKRRVIEILSGTLESLSREK